ncbi:extracellular solute-binding protein [Ponticoccus sp. SC2-23]|uniref:extracellular solute-binding protein n=1 Tax=Alexandriicola marinus TaxID=2081710 RepID=UPI000FDA80C7|nr:extracellular solute-binding protein [Alexandriicola marinus]MBM1221371.1 extracellular solute-binding protein [Ponticoccus sp. SC6-9]MBM1226412.1 extracellular solute-binding protein [Ponticoccus sp. SC6-15]MBM1230363.1 extracellular solute-binding protein [Ponticoccus sp. SC6-38]MBM1234886.1 extracellular solute-binding protein [Ponticoccus sp. SC6-45]MBM1239384.1 extracellular solute-binding protein [Ponticoccus sp. SC6-49]MBM1243166.1 extracellular solute-binding protein [Ponticoccus s
MKTFIRTIAASSVLAISASMAAAEGNVTVYTAVPQNFIDALVPMFEEDTGISVEIIKAGSGELLNRMTAEADSPMADVLWSVDGTVIDFNPTLFEAYEAAGSDMLADGMKQSDMWTPFTAVVMALIVNEGQLDGKPVPDSWAALADPMYDDMISSARAEASGSAYIQLATVLQAFESEEAGWEIYEGLLSNFVLSDSSGAVPRFVNDGELAIGVTLEDAALRYVEGGGPVQIVYPAEGTAIAPDAMALVAGAPNADNAKAFLDFMLSADAQAVVAEQGRRPVRSDVASNPALLPLNEVNSVGYDAQWAADNRARLVDAWKDMVLDVQ